MRTRSPALSASLKRTRSVLHSCSPKHTQLPSIPRFLQRAFWQHSLDQSSIHAAPTSSRAACCHIQHTLAQVHADDVPPALFREVCATLTSATAEVDQPRVRLVRRVPETVTNVASTSTQLVGATRVGRKVKMKRKKIEPEQH